VKDYVVSKVSYCGVLFLWIWEQWCRSSKHLIIFLMQSTKISYVSILYHIWNSQLCIFFMSVKISDLADLLKAWLKKLVRVIWNHYNLNFFNCLIFSKEEIMTRLNIVQDLFEYKIPKNVGHSIKKLLWQICLWKGRKDYCVKEK